MEDFIFLKSQGGTGSRSFQRPSCLVRASSSMPGNELSLLYLTYVQAKPRLTCSLLASTPLQNTTATVRPYRSMVCVSKVASAPEQISDRDSFDFCPNGCFFSGASMLARRIFTGVLSTRSVIVSPSLIPMTLCANAKSPRNRAITRIKT